MNDESGEHYFVSKHYRCLNYHHRLSQELYLLMCGIEQCVPGKSRGPERRPGYHLHVVLTGEGVLEVNGTRTAVHGGQMFLLKPDATCYYCASQERPWTYCWVTFDGDRAGYYMDQAGFTAGTSVRNCYVDPDGFYELANALLEKPELNLAKDLRRQGLLNQFLALAVESYNRSRHGRRNGEYSTNSYVDHALDFIHANYDRIKVTDISDFIGIDRSYFTHIFKDRVGVSPQQYLIRVRMRHGAELLRGTDQPIKEIARKAGYEDSLTFSKAFKIYYGVSPKVYRLQPEEERVYLDPIPLPWREDSEK